MEYLPTLRRALISPLTSEGNDGVPAIIKLMNAYDLLRSDFDSVLELSSWPGMPDPMSLLDSKVYFNIPLLSLLSTADIIMIRGV